MGQSEPISTAEKLASEHGVSSATVKRAGKFAEEVERKPELQKAIHDRTPVKKVVKEQRKVDAATVKRAGEFATAVETGGIGNRFQCSAKRAGEFATAVETVREQEPETAKGQAVGQPKHSGGAHAIPPASTCGGKTMCPPSCSS